MSKQKSNMHALSLPDDRSLSDSLVVFFPANNIPKQHLARVGTTHHTDRQSFHLVSVICKWAVSRAAYSTTYATGRDLPCSTDLLMLTHLPNSLSKRGRSTTQKTPRPLWICPDVRLRFDWNGDGRFESGDDLQLQLELPGSLSPGGVRLHLCFMKSQHSLQERDTNWGPDSVFYFSFAFKAVKDSASDSLSSLSSLICTVCLT